jgi:hypothetical protein
MGRKRKEVNEVQEFNWVDVDFGDFEAASNDKKQSVGYRTKGDSKILRYGGYNADFPLSERGNFGLILDNLLKNIANKGIDINDKRIRININLIRDDKNV